MSFILSVIFGCHNIGLSFLIILFGYLPLVYLLYNVYQTRKYNVTESTSVLLLLELIIAIGRVVGLNDGFPEPLIIVMLVHRVKPPSISCAWSWLVEAARCRC